MKKIIISFLFTVSVFAALAQRWALLPEGGIEWTPTPTSLPHNDHIEMSGQQLSAVLRYGVDVQGQFTLNRALMFPMLRQKPVTRTQAHLKQRTEIDIVRMITVGEMTPVNEHVESITLDGVMTVRSTMDFQSGRNMVKKGLRLCRTLFPSPRQALYVETYDITNTSPSAITLRLPTVDICYDIAAEQTLYGDYKVEVSTTKDGWFELKPDQTLTFSALFCGRKADTERIKVDVAAELASRRALIDEWWSSLVLDTPDPILNRMFAFAKLRASESIYKTKGGFMHGPGGEAYYAAIWANDQAEYVNPFFPFLGYETGNESAINSFRHFARFMNSDYKPIPSSIISEGASTWHGAKDRGDGAMIAYGAARYALARGDKAQAEELWPLIEWCLEFCRRKVNDDGVVASDSDELENRFPAGKANLCTSSLYYDALISAAHLARELGKSTSVSKNYTAQAAALRSAMELHFGRTVEGFDTYRYYNGNDILRSWICIPLTVGIYDRASATIDALFSPRLWSDDGLLTQAGTETYWDRTTLYALRGVFASGDTKRGLEFLEHYSRRRLLGDHVPYAIEAWPEGNQRHLSAESGLYCRIYTEGLFGIRPTGLRTMDITPHLPQSWPYMNLHHIKAFGSVFDIAVARKGDKLAITITSNGKTITQKDIKQGQTLSVKL